MPVLMEKCEHFLQEKLRKLDPSDPEHLDLLAAASTHNLSSLARDLIPKVANLSVVDIRKYYGVIKPSYLMCVMELILHRYVPGTGITCPPDSGHSLIGSVTSGFCAGGCGCQTGSRSRIQTVVSSCGFCAREFCSQCASTGDCEPRKGRMVKICLYCGVNDSPCACALEIADEHLLNLK